MDWNRRFKQWLDRVFFRPSYLPNAIPDDLITEQNDSQRLPDSAQQKRVAALIEELKQSSPSARISAIDALAEIGQAAEAAVPALTDTLRNDNDIVRKRAISALGRIGPKAKAAIVPLIGIVNGKESKIKRMAADALLLIDPKGVALVEALNSSDPEIRNGATYALLRIGSGGRAAVPTLIEALGHADRNIRRTVVEALGRIGSPSVQSLIEALKKENVRRSAIAALTLIGPGAEPAIPELAEILKGSDFELSVEAVNALARIGPAAIPTLNDALSHGGGGIRSRTARALADMGAEARASVPALIVALTDYHARPAAAYALGEIGPDAKEAIPSLVGFLGDENWDSQKTIVRAISKFGAVAVPALTEALAHPEVGVRKAAAEALASIGPDAASSVAELIGAFEDQVESVRASAGRALVAIIPDTKRQANILIEGFASGDPGVRETATTILCDIGPPVVPPMVDALNDQRELVRTCAVDVLVRTGRESVPALIEVLKNENESVRDSATKALRLISDTLTYTKIPESPVSPDLEYEIDYRHLDDARLQELSDEAPHVIEYLYDDGLQHERRPRLRQFVPLPQSERLPELKAMIHRRQQVLADISTALEATSPVIARDIVEQSSQPIEPQRYTDITIYEGFLYQSDDLAAASQLSDQVPLAAGKPYTLGVAIRLKRTGIDSDKHTPRGVKNPRQDKEDLTIYLLTKPRWPGIEIQDSFAKVTWPYNTDSESALFKLNVRPVSGRMSQGSIEVRLYDRSLDLLDIVRVFVTVVPHDPEGKRMPGVPARHLLWPDKEPGDPRIEVKSPSRLLSTHVTALDKRYRFEFIFRDRNGDVVEVPIWRDIGVADLDNLLVKVRDFWTELVITNYASRLSVTRTTFGKYLNQLRDLGVQAWTLLFGAKYADQAGASEALGDFLTTMDSAEGAHIQITYSDTYSNFIFPWSILYPPTEDSAVEPLNFWGARYQIEQVTSGPKRETLADEPINVLFALDTSFGNSAVQEEALEKYQTASGGRLRVTNPISDQQTLFKELVRNPSAHLLYFYCHAYASTRPGPLRPDGVQLLKSRIEAIRANSPERQALDTLLALTARMGDESWIFIGDSEVKESKLKLQKFFEKRRPIVFLNMCQSADLLPSMSNGLVRLFLDHNASAVVGTESPMTAVFAHAFANLVFEALFGGDDIGTALWKARRHFLRDDMRNPLGLAYTLYGRAIARLGNSPIIAATMDSNLNPTAGKNP